MFSKVTYEHLAKCLNQVSNQNLKDWSFRVDLENQLGEASCTVRQLMDTNVQIDGPSTVIDFGTRTLRNMNYPQHKITVKIGGNFNYANYSTFLIPCLPRSES
jgi:hypothetical protein